MEDILVDENMYLELINAINNVYIVLLVIALLIAICIIYSVVSNMRI